jgi:hypothetical protein
MKNESRKTAIYYKGKGIPATGHGGPWGWVVKAPIFSRQSTHRRRWDCQPYTPEALNPPGDSWYSFLLEAESTPGHSVAGRIRSIEKSNDLIRNWTQNHLACNILHQQLHYCMPHNIIYRFTEHLCYLLPNHRSGARGSVVGWGTMLQTGRSLVQVPDKVDFFQTFQLQYGPGVDSASNRNE